MTTRIIAIDWSGQKLRTQQKKKIWLAEAVNGELQRLEPGRSRAEITEHLISYSRQHSRLIIGFDFAFSFPERFFKGHDVTTASELWTLTEREGEHWLADCQPPFWGLPGCKQPKDRESIFRQTEKDLLVEKSLEKTRPKSVFQIGGAGAVGKGSIRGMPFLLQLNRAGFSIWPFDVPNYPLVVEIYPRLLTGPVVKSNPDERDKYLRRYPELSPAHRQLATESDDAFDAAVSALEMSRQISSFDDLVRATDRQILLEGMIWYPRDNPNTPN